MKKRESMQIIYDILKTVRDGKSKKTHIMYKANLSPQMLEDYLRQLIDKELLKKEEGYSITDKGCKYIEEFVAITRFIEAYDLD
jgi:predicted transcriptional regulator